MPLGEVRVPDRIEHIAETIFEHHPHQPPGRKLWCGFSFLTRETPQLTGPPRNPDDVLQLDPELGVISPRFRQRPQVHVRARSELQVKALSNLSQEIIAGGFISILLILVVLAAQAASV